MVKVKYSMSDIEEKVIYIIEEIMGAGDVHIGTNIVKDLGADSLDIVDIIMRIEEDLDMYIPDNKINNCSTVYDICELIAKEKENGNPINAASD